MTDLTRVRRALWHLRTSGMTGLREHNRRRKLQQRSRRASGVHVAPDGTVSFDPWPVDRRPPRRPGLRVAVILDEFSSSALGYEWTQVPITPQNWRRLLEVEPVDLLFVESAWAGNGGAWRYQLTGTSGVKPAVRDLLAWCRENGVRSVFWNKEDPVHHEDFLEAAALFDHVFTTDATMLSSYRDALGNNRVGVLPFAAQPAIHNPVRPDHSHAARDVAFGGMYFTHRHEERRRQMDMLLGAAAAVSPRMEHGLEIFSRELGGDERYQFPPPLDSHVVGSLDYSQMLTAYRSYKVFLNVNTVVGSPTMCARRIYEISACGTPVVSTPSPAIDAVFPADEVVQVGTAGRAEFTIRALVNSPELRDRMVHRAQRRIWAEHTYAHRVDHVLGHVGLGDHAVTRAVPQVTALVSSIRPAQLDHVLETVGSQRGVDVQLAYLAHGWDPDEADLRARTREHGIDQVAILRADRSVPLGECLNRLVATADGTLVAKLDDDDLYGPYYLLDQVNALTYSAADVVGKQAHYVHLTGSDLTALRFGHREHRYTDFVMGPTIVTTAELARRVPFAELPRGEDTGFLKAVGDAGGRIYAADRFGFAQVRGGTEHTWAASDAEILASSEVQASGPPVPHIFV